MNFKAKADYCGLSEKTIRRYESSNTPRWYQHLMKYRAGQLPGWPEFRFEPGQVWTPAGQVVFATEVEHVRWMFGIIGEMNHFRQDSSP